MAENKDMPQGANTASSAEGLVKATIKQPGRKNVSRRWLVVGGVLLGVILLSSTLFSSKPQEVAAPPVKSILDMTPKGLTEKSWQVQSQADIETLRNSVDALKKENSQLAAKATPTAPPAMPAGAPMPPPLLPTAAGGNNLAALPPPPPPLPPLPRNQGNSVTPDSGTGAATASDGQPQVFTAPQAESAATPLGGALAEKVDARVAYKKNDFAGYLPAGSFAPAALLHGLDAAAAVSAQANPQPVLLRIQDKAVLPGSAHYDLKSCFVIASAFGDLSSERVYLRLAKLSCVDKKDRLVLSSPIQGYVVDSDGKLGLRGKLVDRQGAKLGKALLAGFAQGLTSAFGASQGTTSMSSLTGATSMVSGGAALNQAGLAGAGAATSQLAQFYLQQAQAIFPVIEINAGRQATIVIQDGTALAWNDENTLYVKNVTPQAAAQ